MSNSGFSGKRGDSENNVAASSHGPVFLRPLRTQPTTSWPSDDQLSPTSTAFRQQFNAQRAPQHFGVVATRPVAYHDAGGVGGGGGHSICGVLLGFPVPSQAVRAQRQTVGVTFCFHCGAPVRFFDVSAVANRNPLLSISGGPFTHSTSD